MPSTEAFPFRRLSVDHQIQGTTRVWWQMATTNFNDAAPHTFQLQAGYTGLPTATDWQDVGSPVTDAWYADDDVHRLKGKRLFTHYRVKLTTPLGSYVSGPVGVYGELQEQDWLLARELVRKEVLRSGLVGREGILLKRIRYGARCSRCLNYLTKEVEDSRCPECNGVGFKVGYHAPAAMQCWDLSPEKITEKRNATQPPGQIRDTIITARVLGFPDLALEDVWVDAHSDQRWFVDEVEHLTVIRGVPIVMAVTLRLAEYTNQVYRLQIGGEANDHPLAELPTAGAGCVQIDHDTGGEDALAYQLSDGCGIPGAYVYAFSKSDYDAGLRTPGQAQAASTTMANGRWSYALKLDPGEYVLVFEKPGEYGPDARALSVTDPHPPAPPPLSSLRSSSSSSGFGPF